MLKNAKECMMMTEVVHNPKLTTAEISEIWNSYMQDTMATCILKVFLSNVNDPNIKPIIEFALSLSQSHIKKLTSIFNNEKIPVPHGFTDEDVNINAPRLFSDNYYLRYLEYMARAGLGINGKILGISTRNDIRQYYSETVRETIELYNKVLEVQLAKGILVRSPMMVYPEKVEFIKKGHFLEGLFGRNRPLLGTEISHLATNMEVNGVGGSFLMGLSQTAANKDVREYMLRGQKIAQKHIEVLGSILTEDNIAVPSSWDSEVGETTVAPFSDKLAVLIVSTLSAIGIGNYGFSIGASMRSDLVTTYARLMAEQGKYAEDGANIMISHGWLEQPPQTVDRKALQRV
jgi:hypothetical protein